MGATSEELRNRGHRAYQNVGVEQVFQAVRQHEHEENGIHLRGLQMKLHRSG